jgi:hypothetical protein
MYFTRAKYNPYKELLEPPFDSWEKICICQMPFNPDKLYITCDLCQKSFHPQCFGIKEEDIEKIEFFCNECKKKKKFIRVSFLKRLLYFIFFYYFFFYFFFLYFGFNFLIFF